MSEPQELLYRQHKRNDVEISYDKEFRKILTESGVIDSVRRMTRELESSYDPPNLISGASEYKWDKENSFWEEIAINGIPTVRRDINIPVTPVVGRGTFLVPGGNVNDEKTGMEVTILGKSNRAMKENSVIPFVGVAGQVENPTRIDKTSYLKITKDGKSYFVKKSTATQNPGISEFNNTVKVKEALKELPYVDIIDAKLGYTDANESWFVSVWDEVESRGYAPFVERAFSGVNDYGVAVPAFRNRDNLNAKVKEIKNMLEKRGIYLGDDYTFNFFYNPETDRIMLLDITDKNSKKLKQPAPDSIHANN